MTSAAKARTENPQEVWITRADAMLSVLLFVDVGEKADSLPVSPSALIEFVAFASSSYGAEKFNIARADKPIDQLLFRFCSQPWEPDYPVSRQRICQIGIGWVTHGGI
jgi:hypothetical protein